MASVAKSDKLDQESDVPATAPSKQAPPPAKPPKAARGSAGGFFAIYKRGQGYWTRMGTVIAAGVIGAFIAYNIYSYAPSFFSLPDQGKMTTAEFQVATANAQTLHQHVALGISLGFLLAYCLIGWYAMNKPSNVEFLIATDVEMKKVNWTSKRELIGSTKVIIAFMFLTAIFLFTVDMIFRFLMQVIHVLNWGAPF
ncbi:MAG TPA: preprotein translocase subunit SecE [Tepidisphaeraceae bacterium]|jgi:preprotein translocase SecE subunit|nr:preprotein translocase subunit SecE [Tepidisphaeraceae bacterium]